MIYIFCALYQEAVEIIKTYDLKRIDEAQKRALSIHFDVYKNKDIILTVTGTGSVKPVVAVTQVCDLFLDKKKVNIFLNIGIAGGLLDEKHCLLINKIHNDITNRDFYPDMIYDLGIKEVSLTTVAKPIFTKDMKKGEVYDMEAAFLFEGAKYNFSEEKIFFIKLISDGGEADKNLENQIGVSKEHIRNIFANNMKDIKHIISILLDLVKKDIDNYDLEEEVYVDMLAKYLCASETMKNDIKKLIHYAFLIEYDLDTLIENLKKSEELPVKSKKAGKDFLDRIKKEVVACQI